MIKVSLKEILKSDVGILNKYFLVTLIFVLLTIVGYTSYALFSYEEVSSTGIRLKYTGETLPTSNLAFNWKNKTENEESYLAVYTLDTATLPTTYSYNGTAYTLSTTIDVSEQENKSVMLGEYTSGSKMIAVIGQDEGVVAPKISYALFRNLTNVITIDLSNLNTSKTTNFYDMFYGCSRLTSLDLSGFDTSNVINMYRMFDTCSSLTTLDLTSFDTTNVTDMYAMFRNCSSLTSIIVGCNWNISPSLPSGVSSLTNVCTEEITKEIDSGINYLASDWKNKTENEAKYKALYTINTMDFLDTYIYDGNTYTLSATIDVSEQQNGSVILKEYMYKASLISYYVGIIGQEGGVVAPKNSSKLFSFNYKLTTLDVSNLDTSNVTNMASMFFGCSRLTSLDVSNFDTSNVVSMYAMFNSCSSLTSLDVSNFDTRNVTSIASMFGTCDSLTSLDVSNFDTSNVTTMKSMFGFCSSLTELDLSNFDTSNLYTMEGMFDDCSGLTSINLVSFNTFYVGNFYETFSGCTKLTKITVGCNFTMENAFDTTDMFTDAGTSSVTKVCNE